jgi:hypothetical protein
MRTTVTRTTNVRSRVGGTAIALGLAVILGGAYAVPARADENDHRGRGEQRAQQQRERSDFRHRDRRSYGYDRPGYVYSPPPVYYAPPPGPPAIDFVFPLRFR